MKKKINRKKKVNRKLRLMAEFLICSIIIFSVFGLRMSYGKIFLKENKTTEEVTEQTTSQEETTVETSQKLKEEKLPVDQLTTKIDNIISSNVQGNGKISVVYHDIKSGYRYAYKDDEYFSAASTTKVVYALYIYDRIAKGQISKDMVIDFDKNLVVAGGGEITNRQEKDKYPIEEVIMNMLRYSDNTATNMLIGSDANAEQVLGNYLKKLNLKNVENMTSNNKVTTAIMEKVWLYLYENQDKYPKVIEYLKQSRNNEWIKTGVEGKEIASKYGAVGRSLHDTAIVYGKNGDYIILIYTEDLENAKDAISNISKEIDNIHDQNMQT